MAFSLTQQSWLKSAGAFPFEFLTDKPVFVEEIERTALIEMTRQRWIRIPLLEPTGSFIDAPLGQMMNHSPLTDR